jgi:hypothetical protein
MRIFLSYSSKDRPLAEKVDLALLGVGHQVFFDKSSLPPGTDFNSRIRKAIDESDAFVFLISPNSVRNGGYALTELGFAKAKWRKPWGVVLPVMIEPTDHNLIDAYLTAVTILEPKGNAAAEIAAAVQNLPRPSSNVRRNTIKVFLLSLIILLTLALILLVYKPSCSLSPEQEIQVKKLKDNIENNLRDGALDNARRLVDEVRKICPDYPNIREWDERTR